MNAKIISIYSAQSLDSGVLAFNVASSMYSQSKSKTLVLDLTFSGLDRLETLLKKKAEKNIYDVIGMLSKLDENLIKGYIPGAGNGISYVASPEYEIKSAIKGEELEKAIKLLAGIFDYIFILCPQEADAFLEKILSNSDCLLLLIMPHLLSLKNAQVFLKKLSSWHFSQEFAKILFLSGGGKDLLEAASIKDLTGIKIFQEVAEDSAGLITSINNGELFINSQPHTPMANDIKKLAKSLLEGRLFEGIEKVVKTSADRSVVIEIKEDETDLVVLKSKIHKELIKVIDFKKLDTKGSTDQALQLEIRQNTRAVIQDILSRESVNLSREARAELVEELLDEVLGLGCLEDLLKDSDITEIMVNGPETIYVEKQGKISRTGLRFTSNTQLMTVIDRIVSPIGRRVDESSPLVDARLADGSRVNAIIPPISLVGPVVTIRKFSKKKLEVSDLVKFGAIVKPMADFLEICVKLRKNIVISGGTGSGKTTLLNVVSSFIPDDERIVTIEDSAELKLPQEHVVRLESRPPSVENTGAITIRGLVINALRMRPDRIVVGECRGGETLDMLQAMNTGHDGSLTTIHANSPKDGIARITTMAMMSETKLPEQAIRDQIASAIQIIVQLSRLSDGSRKVIAIAEVLGVRNNALELVPIFEYNQTDLKESKVIGKFTATGNIPSFYEDIETHGLKIDRKIFMKGDLA